MRRNASAFAALAVGLLAAGCGVPTQGPVHATDDDAVPFQLLDQSAPPLVPLPAGPVAEAAALCFVREGRLTVVSTSLRAPVSLADVMDALARPPDTDPPVRSALTATVARKVTLSGGVATVDLDDRVANISGEEQILAIAQIVCTLTGRPGVGQVAFTLGGAPLTVPKGDGSTVTSPVARDDYASLIG